MSVTISRRTTCRLCESEDLELVLPLEPSAVADAFVPAERLDEPQPAYPLDVFLCRGCGHVQLLDVLDPEALFADYIYTSQGSPGLVDHFRRYSEELVRRVEPAAGSLAVDIGSNDGTLLRFMKDAGMQVVGIDPAREIARRATESGIPTLNRFFGPDVADEVRGQHGAATIVTANNVFAHADDLGGIAAGVSRLLAPDGVFVFEVSYLLDTLRNMVFDYVYHEHLAYHAVKPLRGFLARHGMELFDVERIPTKGGSIRAFAQLSGGPRATAPAVAELIAEEDAAGLDRPETYKAFGAKVNELRDQTRALLAEAAANGATIAGYGASATGTTLMHHFGLGEYLSFIVDDNEDRQGLYSPGHHVPVRSPDALYEEEPAVVVVLAWRFAKPIVASHERYLENGGRFLVPLPEVRLVDAATAYGRSPAPRP